MNYIKRFSGLLIFIFSVIGVQAQNPGVKISAPAFNQALISAENGKLLSPYSVKNKFERRDAGDTLSLPFFDDFTSTVVYPDQKLWVDSLVYINSNFPLSPPSFGVATFDNLNKNGRPYQENMNIHDFRAWDTLTSKPINLKNHNDGGNIVDYKISDSIYLSFFYQGMGLGDKPEVQDSFVLQFRKRNGIWYNEWSGKGIDNGGFKQVLVGVLDSNYLWEAFQFRFLNYTFASGNLNHVHLDYVRMNANRDANDTLIKDVAINKKPSSLLRKYSAMPYTHFLADAGNQTALGHIIGVRNNDIDVINTQFEFEAVHKSSQVAFSPFSANNRNIFAMSDSSETFDNFDLTGFPTNEYLRIKNTYRINPQAGNTTPATYNSLGNNDEIIVFQDFKNYYAYDDGSAEGGIGLSYEGLPPGRGSFALEYELTKPDTLSGISIFFNSSLEDVSARQFALCIWLDLADGSMIDKPIYETPQIFPTYTDSINGFYDFVFDTTIVLPKGKFYIGWTQNAIFNLNVGYDNNYRMDRKEQRNTNILYNLEGNWSRVEPVIKGAPMIRPLIGEYSEWPLNAKNISPKNSSFNIFPNPNLGIFTIENISKNSFDNQYFVYSITGKEIQSGRFNNSEEINISQLPSGMYLIVLKNDKGIFTEKIIKE